MKTVKVTRGQYHALQNLTRKEVATLRKYPKILVESKRLLRACKSVSRKSRRFRNMQTGENARQRTNASSAFARKQSTAVE